MRPGWAVVAGAALLAAPPGGGEVLRVRAVVLVDAAGNEVGRLAATERGAELVLGGESQASLVTDGPLAALNLVGDTVLVRELPTAPD